MNSSDEHHRYSDTSQTVSAFNTQPANQVHPLKKKNSDPALSTRAKPALPQKPAVAKKPVHLSRTSSTDLQGKKKPPPLPQTPPKGRGKPPPPPPQTGKTTAEAKRRNFSQQKAVDSNSLTSETATECTATEEVTVQGRGSDEITTQGETVVKYDATRPNPEERYSPSLSTNHDPTAPETAEESTSITQDHPIPHVTNGCDNMDSQNATSSLEPSEKNSPHPHKISPKVPPKPRAPKPASRSPTKQEGENTAAIPSNTPQSTQSSQGISLHDSFSLSLGQSTFYVPNHRKSASDMQNDNRSEVLTTGDKEQANQSSQKVSSESSDSNCSSASTIINSCDIHRSSEALSASDSQNESDCRISTVSVAERTALFSVISADSVQQSKGDNSSRTFSTGQSTSDNLPCSQRSDTYSDQDRSNSSYHEQCDKVSDSNQSAKETTDLAENTSVSQRKSPRARPVPRKRLSLSQQAAIDSDGVKSNDTCENNSVNSLPVEQGDTSTSNSNQNFLSVDTDEAPAHTITPRGVSPPMVKPRPSPPIRKVTSPPAPPTAEKPISKVRAEGTIIMDSTGKTEESGDLGNIEAKISKDNSSDFGNVSEKSNNNTYKGDSCENKKSSNLQQAGDDLLVNILATNTEENSLHTNDVSPENKDNELDSNQNVASTYAEKVPQHAAKESCASGDELVVETTSLLDEMEKIISRRMSELGSKFGTELKDCDLNSATEDNPVPPTRHKKNRQRSQTTEIQCRSLDFADFRGSSSSINSDSGIIIPPAVSRRTCPPKPKRNKLANRSHSDVCGLRTQVFQNKGEIPIDSSRVEIDSRDNQESRNSPALPKRQGSIKADFCVPANQHALLREIALADHKKEQEKSDSNSATNSLERRKPRPTRKAPPPPPGKNKEKSVPGDMTHTLGNLSSSLNVLSSVGTEVLEREYDGISPDEHDHEYLEIPESFSLHQSGNPSKSPEGMTTCSSGNEISPTPPELPPRNSTSPRSSDDSSPRISGISPLPSDLSSSATDIRGDRPVSRVSTCSVLSSTSESGSVCPFEQTELSSSESDGEDEEERLIRKKEKKIFYIAREIWSSEKVFVDVLKLLDQDFRVHIAKSKDSHGKPVIQDEVLNKVLKYLPQLYNLNQDLLHDLEERVNNWDKRKQIADIFVKKGPFLKLYTSYIRDFSETTEAFDEACKKHQPFHDAVRKFEMSPRCASLSLKHYMLKPIQRIPQYQLLLQDYLKNLSSDSADLKDTEDALNIVRKVADHANESMKQGDEVQKMLEIQKLLDGNFEVIKPGRILLKQGELKKLSRKEMQPRMFFLFNDVLLYTTPTTSGGYRLNNALTLNGMKVLKASLDEFKSEFDIITVTRSFTVEARTIQERDEWMAALQKAIEQNTQRKKTFEKMDSQSVYNIDYELGSKAPIWIPDARVTMCMICTSEFSVTWRRHHCRACGRVLCSHCSDNKAPLEYLRNKPARVCDECFSQLKSAAERKSQSLTEHVAQDTNGSSLSLGGLMERFQQIRKSSRFTSKLHIRRPARLKEVHANDTGSLNSGYLKVFKGKKWKKYWFVLKDKVLYTYKASNDMAAIESMPVVGYAVGTLSESYEGCQPILLFQLIHKNRPALVFQAEDKDANRRWIAAMEEASRA